MSRLLLGPTTSSRNSSTITSSSIKHSSCSHTATGSTVASKAGRPWVKGLAVAVLQWTPHSFYCSRPTQPLASIHLPPNPSPSGRTPWTFRSLSPGFQQPPVHQCPFLSPGPPAWPLRTLLQPDLPLISPNPGMQQQLNPETASARSGKQAGPPRQRKSKSSISTSRSSSKPPPKVQQTSPWICLPKLWTLAVPQMDTPPRKMALPEWATHQPAVMDCFSRTPCPHPLLL